MELRARILPGERLEAALLTDQSREVVYDLIEEEQPGAWPKERQEYLYRTAPAGHAWPCRAAPRSQNVRNSPSTRPTGWQPESPGGYVSSV